MKTDAAGLSKYMLLSTYYFPSYVDSNDTSNLMGLPQIILMCLISTHSSEDSLCNEGKWSFTKDFFCAAILDLFKVIFPVQWGTECTGKIKLKSMNTDAVQSCEHLTNQMVAGPTLFYLLCTLLWDLCGLCESSYARSPSNRK